jgi:hypothetical protein
MNADLRQLKDRVDGLLGRAAALADEFGNKPVAGQLGEARDRLRAEELYLVITGEAKRGKSEIVNALLDEPGLCPTGLNVTTAAVTLVRYGPAETITAVLDSEGGGGGAPQHRPIASRAELRKYLDEQQNDEVRGRLRAVQIEVPHPLLKDGLVIVDTPGVGNFNVRHTEVTRAFLPSADVILFVGDVLSPYSDRELEFLRAAVESTRNVVFAVNKTDKRAGPELDRFLAEQRVKVAAVLGVPQDEVRLHGVSADTKLVSLRTGGEKALARSNFPALAADLGRLLGADRGRVALSSALAKVGQGVGALRRPLEAELRVYETGRKDEAARMEKEWDEALARLKALEADGAAWRTRAQDRLDDIDRALRTQLQLDLRDVRTEAERMLEDSALVLKSDEIARKLRNRLGGLERVVGKAALDKVADLHAELRRSSGLALRDLPAGGLTATPARQRFSDVVPDEVGWSEKAMVVGRPMLYKSLATGVVGVLLVGYTAAITGGLSVPLAVLAGYKVTALSLGGVAVVAGKAWGAVEGLLKLRAREPEADAARKKLARVLRDFLDESEQQLGNALGALLRQQGRALRDDLNAQIAEKRKEAEGVLDAIRKARSAPPASVAANAAAVRDRLARVDAVDREAAGLFREVRRLTPTTGTDPADGDPTEFADV